MPSWAAAVASRSARGAGGALRGDDLQRDFAAAPLVMGVPDRPHSAAAERSEGPVAPEDEPVRESREPRPPPSPLKRFARATEFLSVRKDLATVARISAANQAMTEHDTDLDFDFFGDDEPEPPPREAGRAPAAPGRPAAAAAARRGARPRRCGPPGADAAAAPRRA